jgi:uncharacterized protein (TIGR02246 family)
MNAVAAARPLAPTRAEAAIYTFIAAIGAGDLRGAAACFTREGCLITPDGTAIHGRPHIASILAQMIARRTEIEVEQLVLHRADDVAMASGWFAICSDGPDRARIRQACGPAMALNRVEGSWKIAVLAPWAKR